MSGTVEKPKNMPDEKTVNEKYEEIAKSMNLKANDNISVEKKWDIVQMREKTEDKTMWRFTPDETFKKFKGKDAEFIENLTTMLRTYNVEWGDRFMSLGGHELIFSNFSESVKKSLNYKKAAKSLPFVELWCRCIKALVNLPNGFKETIGWRDSTNLLFTSIRFVDDVEKSNLFYVLSALCILSEDGRVKVLSTLENNNGFTFIVELLLKTNNEELISATMTFLNAVISTVSNTESRVLIRNKFLTLNILQILEKFSSNKPSESLEIRIEAFYHSLQEDMETMKRSGYSFEGLVQTDIKKSSSKDKDANSNDKKLDKAIRDLEFENRSLKDEVEDLKNKLIQSQNKPIQTIDSSNQQSSLNSDVSMGDSMPSPLNIDSSPSNSTEVGPLPPPPPPSGGPPPPPPPGGGPPPPPPPPGGGPPPPGGGPPPPGMMQAKRPPKAKRNPNKKMKAFQWNKIPDSKIDKTLWEKATDENVKLDTLEFESLFGIESGGTSDKKNTLSNSANVKPKIQKIQLLDPKRSNNCEIMLKGLKLDPTTIKKAIVSLDMNILTEETVKTLKEYVPQSEEIALLKSFDGDKNLLGSGEKYFMEVMDIPKLALKLKALEFKVSFENKADLLKSEILTITKSIDSVRNSKNVEKLLEIVLAFGNYLNGTGNNGGCYGFRITSLNKLFDVKSSDGSQTLMHYLHTYLSKNTPSVLSLSDEMNLVHDSSRINIRELSSNLNELKGGLSSLNSLLEDQSLETKYKSLLQPFAEIVGKDIDSIEKRLIKIEPSFKECVIYFGEPPTTESEDFFSVFSNFIKSLERAGDENKKRVERLEKETKTKTFTSQLKARQIEINKKGQVDDIIEDLKKGKL